MEHGFFSTIFYIPLYNGLIFLIDVVPGYSAGIAVVLLTILIRLILYPLARQSIKTQIQMRKIEPQLAKIREKVKDRQEQAKQLMQAYKDNDIHPFSGLLLIIIQLPILIGLYQVFQSGLPTVNPGFLYSFVAVPASVTMTFLGLSLVGKSVILAILSVITQFIQLQLALPKMEKKKTGEKSLQQDIAYSMNTQMKYIFPLILFPIAFISPVIGLYMTASNIFMIFQELFVKRKLEKAYASQVIAPQQ